MSGGDGFDRLSGDHGQDDAFDFIGTAAFSGQGGEVRFQAMGSAQLLQIDTSGNGQANMEIRVLGTQPLTADDFTL